MAYNFGPKGRPSHLSEWGIPAGKNHGSPFGTTGEDKNLLLLLLFLRFGDGGPTVGKRAGTSNLTEEDQRLYSSTEEPLAARRKGCRERWEVTEN